VESSPRTAGNLGGKRRAPFSGAHINPREQQERPKNHIMSFAAVTAVLRAAGLAADHHHPPRAIFERLDGSVGTVEHEATVSRW
jgi:hypothetical protein